MKRILVATFLAVMLLISPGVSGGGTGAQASEVIDVGFSIHIGPGGIGVGIARRPYYYDPYYAPRRYYAPRSYYYGRPYYYRYRGYRGYRRNYRRYKRRGGRRGNRRHRR